MGAIPHPMALGGGVPADRFHVETRKRKAPSQSRSGPERRGGIGLTAKLVDAELPWADVLPVVRLNVVLNGRVAAEIGIAR